MPRYATISYYFSLFSLIIDMDAADACFADVSAFSFCCLILLIFCLLLLIFLSSPIFIMLFCHDLFF